MIILLATRCTKCNKTGTCHKLSFLPLPDWPNDMQTNQWNSLMSVTGYSTWSPIRELTHGHCSLCFPHYLIETVSLMFSPIWEPLLECSDSAWLGPLTIISFFFFFSPVLIQFSPCKCTWLTITSKNRKKKKKRTCVSEVGIEHSVMKLNKKLGNETAYMEILYIIRHHCQTVARDLK